MDWFKIAEEFNNQIQQEKDYTRWMTGYKQPSMLDNISNGVQEAKLFNAKKTVSNFPKITGGTELSPLVSNGSTAKSSFGAFLKGAGGFGNLAKVGTSAFGLVNSIPGVKADYQDGFSKALDIGGTATGIAGSLGSLGVGTGLGLASSAIPVVGWGIAAATLANNVFGKRAGDHAIGADAVVGSGYNSLTKDVGGVGKKTTLTGNLFGYKGNRTNTINHKRELMDTRRAISSGIGYANNSNILAASNTSQDIASKNYQKLIGGQKTNILAAKKGTKLSLLKSIKERVTGRIEKVEPEQKNVIPSGALHARKNNLPEEIASEVTHKGIPVISKDGDKIQQHAEIENSELILTKKVTVQIEELLKRFEEGNENAAVEAGKLLAYEILENTEDNVGLLETI